MSGRGPKIQRAGDNWSVRIRCGKGQNPRFAIHVEQESDARNRADRMTVMARALVKAGRATEAPIILRKAGEQTPEAAFREVEAFVAELCAKAPVPSKGQPLPAKRKPTFRELGVAWTSGELHRRYPDQIPLKATAKDDAGRLDSYVYPLIGDKPIDEVTLDDCEEIMRRLPESAARSRRHVAGTIARVFRMACYPLRLIAASPLPKGFLPPVPRRKAMAYLFPNEDAKLMACTDIPYEYRLFWGFLCREGMREGEALKTTWDCLDLDHGLVRLDSNKTDDPRSWALDPGVARALRIHRERFAGDVSGSAPVLIQRSKYGLAETFRTHLQRAGVNRAELYIRNDARQPIRVHDCRSTFCTLSLAAGKSERWVMARTGHTTSSMLSRYHRTAMSFTELGLGELSPLDEAIPELRALRPAAPAQGEPQGEPMTSVDEANYMIALDKTLRPQRDLNPCYRRERPMS